MNDEFLDALARRYGTPLYVYDAEVIEDRHRRLSEAFAALGAELHYSVKANSNRAVLELLRDLGTGFDVVSWGEAERCLRLGAPASELVFAGVGKTEPELSAALDAGVGLFNVESATELEQIERLAAAAGVVAQIALRVNPDVDAQTHDYISTGRARDKFGLDASTARTVMERAIRSDSLRLRGFHCHLGSQIMTTAPFGSGARVAAEWVRQARAAGADVDLVNLGGGFGIPTDSAKLDLDATARAIGEELAGLGVRVLLEPGRVLVAESGVLLARVTTHKLSSGHHFVITDAGMNDLLRPALYRAEHSIRIHPPRPGPAVKTDVVGPVCETADFLGRGRSLPVPQTGDLVVVESVGAYGFAMASNYNSRMRAAEVMVRGEHARLVRRRETLADLLRAEEELSGP